MLTFTSRGAVSAPVTLQIRVAADDPGALRAGVATPSRDMTPDEVLAAIRHFTTGRSGPRTRPCTRLAISGAVGLPPGVLTEARALGITHIVLHGRAPGIESEVDTLVVRVRHASDLPETVPGPSWVAVLQLSQSTVDALDGLTDALLALPPRSRPDRVVLAWPFPGHDGDALPHVPTAAARARGVRERLDAAGLVAMLRGLPPCLDGSTDGRTRNRFYVDADHQGDDARLWVPDVVQYLKPDSCRVCRMSARCDGVPAPWLQSGILGPLEPIRP